MPPGLLVGCVSACGPVSGHCFQTLFPDPIVPMTLPACFARPMYRLSVAVLTLASLSACGGGEADRPHLSLKTTDELRAPMSAVVKDGLTPGASVYIDHPAFQPFEYAAGVASIASRVPLTTAHTSRTGSQLKVPVAIAVLQLVEQSRLSLSATLDQVLPAQYSAQVPLAQAITVRMLLQHTSGIPDAMEGDFNSLVFADLKRRWTTADYLARAKAQPRVFAPGAGWAYSNTNYVLLSEVLSHVTRLPWRQVLAERVFQRAGIQVQGALPAVGDVTCGTCARGYVPTDDGMFDVTEIDPSMAGGAGGHAWVATSQDRVRLLKALFDGRLFDKASTLEHMMTFVPAPGAQDPSTTGYGLGLTRIEVNGLTLVGHFGGTGGFQNFMFYEPRQRIAVAGFVNIMDDQALLRWIPLLMGKLPGLS